MKKRLPLLILILWTLGAVVQASAAENAKIYTNRYSLYSVDYPETWQAREMSNLSGFYSPRESKLDKFAENVQIVVEDLSQVPGNVSLVDYHRKGVASAEKFLNDFKSLEETTTQWLGRETIITLYSATMHGEHFKFKDYKFMVNRRAYVLTYSALAADFDTYLPAAERLIRSIRVSP